MWFWVQISRLHKLGCMLFLGHCHKRELQRKYRCTSSMIRLPLSSKFHLTCFLLIQVIAKARVPIIKFVEKRSSVAFDIRFINFIFLFLHWIFSFLISYSLMLLFCTFISPQKAFFFSKKKTQNKINCLWF